MCYLLRSLKYNPTVITASTATHTNAGWSAHQSVTTAIALPRRLTALELGGQDLNLISRFDWYVTTLAGC